MDPELKRMQQLQRINCNIEVYRRLLSSTNMPESGRRILQEEIRWLEDVIIPQEKFYDV